MSSRRTRSGYANRRIEYQPNAVSVVCTVFSATPAIRYFVSIVVIVSHRLENHPLRSQPSR